MTKRRIRSHKGGRTCRAPEARMTPQERGKLDVVVLRRGGKYVDWLVDHVEKDYKQITGDNKMSHTYTVSAINEQGASTSAGIDFDHPNGGVEFTSINSAAAAARSELGSGWQVSITNEHGETVKQFTIR